MYFVHMCFVGLYSTCRLHLFKESPLWTGHCNQNMRCNNLQYLHQTAMDTHILPIHPFIPVLSLPKRNWIQWKNTMRRQRCSAILWHRKTLYWGSHIGIQKVFIKIPCILSHCCTEGAVLGQVDHFYWKKEYQARGAPHYHVLLWIRNAPVVGQDEPDEVLQARITCRIPDVKSDPNLHSLVTRYQMHKCSAYCKQRWRCGSTFITRCRFGFPRQACKSKLKYMHALCCRIIERQNILTWKFPDLRYISLFRCCPICETCDHA